MTISTNTVRTGRPLLRSWSDDADETRSVEVVLELAGRQFHGTSPPHESAMEATAVATVDALRSLAGEGVELRFEQMAITDVGGDAPAIVNVLIAIERDGREETHVGAAVDRGDPREATARATLDALNRLLSGFRGVDR